MLIREIWNWLWGSPTIGDERSHRRYYIRKALWEKRAYLWWLYPVIGLYTFGYSASNYPEMDYPGYYEEKYSLPPRVDDTGTAMKSMVAGLAWPAYWVWEIMDDGTATC